MGSYSIRDASLVKRLERAEKDLQYLKSRQYVGNRVLQTKVSVSDELVISDDLINFVDGSVVTQTTYKRVTFKADEQLSPYGRLMFEFFEDDQVTEGESIQVLYYNFIVTQVDDGILQWVVDIRRIVQGSILPTDRFYTRFSVAGTDSGHITVDNAWET